MVYLRSNRFLKTFGKHLKEVRLSKNVSQAQLAYECDMEISQISRMERGLSNTGISNLYLIAKSLEIHPKELLNFEL